MRIALDGSCLCKPGTGLRRYLASLLGACLHSPTHSHTWTVHARTPDCLRDLSVAAAVDGAGSVDPIPLDFRCDHLPASWGGVLSLASTQPWWAWRDAPDLFWGPAHRLPIVLPASCARVVTIHDLCWLRAPATMQALTRHLDAALMPRALRAADRIIAVSEATRRDLIEAFPDTAERVVVVHEAAQAMPDPVSRDDLRALGIDRDYFLFVGTLEPRKNLERLIRAFAGLSESLRQRFDLVIAGGHGWGSVDPARVAADCGIAANLRVLGRVDDATLACLYRHARCLAMPSLYEGFGLPVLEALAQGTPALVSTGSSLPEVAGKAGLVVDPHEVAAIRAGLARLLGDDPLHAQLARAARDQAARFSWARAAEKTLRVFEDARHHRASRRG